MSAENELVLSDAKIKPIRVDPDRPDYGPAPIPPDDDLHAFPCDPRRYRVLAAWRGARVRVDAFYDKMAAKDLRDRLRERFGSLGAVFYIRHDPPEPRWKQVKTELIRQLREKAP